MTVVGEVDFLAKQEQIQHIGGSDSVHGAMPMQYN